MAHSLSARKRARQSLKRRLHNRTERSRLRTELKKLAGFIKAGDKAKSEPQLRLIAKLLDKAAGSGTIHANEAARRKSRFAAAIAAMGAAPASPAPAAEPPKTAAGA
jgi:small subunit ribosomal protein S20